IAAGIALVALGSIAKNAVSKIGSSSSSDVPGFAQGGIVGGSSLYGDKILARLNSKELILNQGMQKDAWNLINNNQSDAGGVVTFEIAGDTLVGALKNGLRGNSRGGGNLSFN